MKLKFVIATFMEYEWQFFVEVAELLCRGRNIAYSAGNISGFAVKKTPPVRLAGWEIVWPAHTVRLAVGQWGDSSAAFVGNHFHQQSVVGRGNNQPIGAVLSGAGP